MIGVISVVKIQRREQLKLHLGCFAKCFFVHDRSDPRNRHRHDGRLSNEKQHTKRLISYSSILKCSTSVSLDLNVTESSPRPRLVQNVDKFEPACRTRLCHHSNQYDCWGKAIEKQETCLLKDKINVKQTERIGRQLRQACCHSL